MQGRYDLRSAREIMDEAVKRLHGDLVDCNSTLQLANALANFDRRYNAVKDRLEGTPLSATLARAQKVYEALVPHFGPDAARPEAAGPAATGEGE